MGTAKKRLSKDSEDETMVCFEAGQTLQKPCEEMHGLLSTGQVHSEDCSEGMLKSSIDQLIFFKAQLT